MCVLVRVRSDSLADMGLRIRNKTMAVRIFRSGENSELWRAIFPNCAPVSLGELRILVSIYSCKSYLVPRGVQLNPFSKHLLDAHLRSIGLFPVRWQGSKPHSCFLSPTSCPRWLSRDRPG